MKTLTCDLCEATAQGETFADWMKNLMPHYMSARPEVMTDETKTAEDKENWMNENKLRFDAADLS